MTQTEEYTNNPVRELSIPNDKVEVKTDRTVAILERTNNCIESGTEFMRASSDALMSTERCLSSINDCINSVERLSGTIVDGITTWKQIDKEMLEMDLRFDMFSKQVDSDLEKYKDRIPVIEKQLDGINASMTKILDYVLAMDATTEMQMEMKMRWMDKIDNFLNTISTMMIKLL